ncbi:MAG: HAMP domain-containing sensor histidine kinase [bacterium]
MSLRSLDTPPKRNPASTSNIKVVLLAVAFVIVAGTLWYSHQIVSELQEKARKIVTEIYAPSLEYIANDKNQGGDFSFVFDRVVQTIDFPVIQTDSNDEPTPWDPGSFKNIDLDSSLTDQQKYLYLKMLIAEMDEQNKPIKVSLGNRVLNYIHYGESPLISKLRRLPYIEFAVVALFILIAYISFSYVKKNEQSSIWVGMARETAHQLGTPLSSMMGWVELLRQQSEENSKITETIRDMENDLQRLQKVADRFSKIGSKPDLKEENLVEIIEKVILYFQRRIPQTEKKVQLTLTQSEPLIARVNRELFEWVIENLVKNALDAIEKEEGRISFSFFEKGEYLYLEVTDSGKGIDPSHRNDIFRPGFSTKKRGWGLGLSLAQRIIESYHRGKLTLKESKPGIGTTFRIRLQR